MSGTRSTYTSGCQNPSLIVAAASWMRNKPFDDDDDVRSPPHFHCCCTHYLSPIVFPLLLASFSIRYVHCVQSGISLSLERLCPCVSVEFLSQNKYSHFILLLSPPSFSIIRFRPSYFRIRSLGTPNIRSASIRVYCALICFHYRGCVIFCMDTF